MVASGWKKFIIIVGYKKTRNIGGKDINRNKSIIKRGTKSENTQSLWIWDSVMKKKFWNHYSRSRLPLENIWYGSKNIRKLIKKDNSPKLNAKTFEFSSTILSEVKRYSTKKKYGVWFTWFNGDHKQLCHRFILTASGISKFIDTSLRVGERMPFRYSFRHFLRRWL